MGHVWMLRPRSFETLDADPEGSAGEMLEEAELLAAYVALCNSLPFVKLLSLYAPYVAGGQFDLSARHVGPISVPDLQLMSVGPDTGRAVRELAVLGRNVQLSSADWTRQASALTSYLYGGVDFDAI
jgi:adenine-specific DNA-methyltransferase